MTAPGDVCSMCVWQSRAAVPFIKATKCTN